MIVPVLYADFNNTFASSRDTNLWAISLHTYGSLKDLSNQGVRLVEEMPIVIYMDSAEGEDLEADAMTYFDPTYKCWMAEIDQNKIRYVPSHNELWEQTVFLCLKCRQDLASFFVEHQRNFESCCPNCGLPIIAATLPPNSAQFQ